MNASKAAESPFDAPVSEDLLVLAAKRDRRAQEALYRLFERPVYTLLRRMTGCPDHAADLTHDSFLHAFERLPQFRREAPFGRWLRAIAASQGLMHLRSGRRYLELFSPEQVMDSDLAIEDVAQHDLEKALSLLPELPRAVLWLYHVEGYTHVEIAGLSGKTVSFSKSQLSRAHHKLRLLLNPGAITSTAATGVAIEPVRPVRPVQPIGPAAASGPGLAARPVDERANAANGTGQMLREWS